jgi:hypothetical protein
VYYGADGKFVRRYPTKKDTGGIQCVLGSFLAAKDPVPGKTKACHCRTMKL